MAKPTDSDAPDGNGAAPAAADVPPSHTASAALARRDRAVLWHPCTQMRDHETTPPLAIARGDGAWLIDADGRRYLDAISSWWVNLFGHGDARIRAAISAQLARLEHVLLAGVTHEPAVALAEALVAAAPRGLSRVFYTDNGASAIEVALKMSFHYWRNSGRPDKQRFVALAGGYHGETLGALGVTDLALYREVYAPLLLTPHLLPSPDPLAWPDRPDSLTAAHRAADALEALLEREADSIAALIVEPIVQCAAGMRVHDPVFLERARELCTRFDVHLIADEIATGFGRTGTLFACGHAKVAPDLMCLSKGLTGGFLALAAVLASEDIYQAFYADWTARRAFLHSHSYTGNPLACAAALAVLERFRERDVLADVVRVGDALDVAWRPLAGHPHVANFRRIGAIVAFDLVADRASAMPFPWQERRGLSVYRAALDEGVLLRPIGHTVYAMPPYCIDDDAIAQSGRAALAGVERATRGTAVPAAAAPAPALAAIADPSGLEV